MDNFATACRQRLRTAAALLTLLLLAGARPAVAAGETESGPSAGESAQTAAGPAATGSIEGTVTYTADAGRPWRYSRYYVDAKNGNALSDALVCLSGAALQEAAPPREVQTAVMDQKDFRFVPETLAIRAGDSVKFTNSDSSTHNVFTRNDLHPFDITLGGEDEQTETFSRAGGSRRPVVLGCHFHGSMRAWIFIFDHPWYQLTGSDGRFSLKNVPPGTYHLEMSHPAGQLRRSRRIEVVAGRTLKLDIDVSPDHKLVPMK